MWLRLRQICLVAADLQAVTSALEHVFGLEVCYVDPAVHKYGLENRLLPIGNQLLEVVSPMRHGTAAGRYLDRRGGDGGYMVITQCDDHAARRAHVEALGVRIANELEHEDYRGMQLHPRDTGGSFFEIDQQLNDDAIDGEWHPAGPRWRDYRRTHIVDAITAAELQSPDPAALASRWGEIAQLPVAEEDGAFVISLENAKLRFVSVTDDRGEGLSALYLNASDPAEAIGRAGDAHVLTGAGQVEIGGVRFYF